MEGIVIPQGLIWLVVGIGVLVQFLREFEAVERVKRFIPYLCIALGAVGVKLFGGLPVADCVQLGVAIGLMAAGGYDALTAFSAAKKDAAELTSHVNLFDSDPAAPPMPSGVKPPLSMLIALLALLLLAGGCSAPLFTAEQKLLLNQSSAVVSELDTRCQAGDDQACREGLHAAAETLRRLAADGQ